ncbi:MAG: nitroreductase family protein [Clostridia bacterium]|nr:nitroreductase family protein [Clostridia bacterium]
MAEYENNAVIRAILTRRTVREYTDEPLSSAQLQTLLNCAMFAPSGRNSQPCVVRVLTDKTLLDRLNTDFKNKVGWDTPAYTRWDKNPVYQNAPALFFIYAPTDARMEAGLMAENIAIGAKGLGLDSVIIGSVGALLEAPEGDEWKKILKVPEPYRFLISVAVGHGAEDPAPKPRKPEEFFVIEK